ncbi:MAG: YihY/virulence factor BrkB family protein [Phycisphaerae bacterium]|nr:YihY/virulence factor BrkB family protein [Phycisphaerae bacterium]
MALGPRLFGAILLRAAAGWLRNDAPRLAAALAFYVVISLAPLLIVSIALSGLVVGPDAGRRDLVAGSQQFLGRQAAEIVAAVVTSRTAYAGSLSLILGGLVLLYAATAVFTMLQDAMNRIWEVDAARTRWWLAVGRKGLVSFLMVLGSGLLLVAAVVANQVIAFIGAHTAGQSHLPCWLSLWGVLNGAVTYSLVFLIFVVIYRVLPAARVPWRAALAGSLLTTHLFAFGNAGFKFAVMHSQRASAYGAAGSAFVFLLWVYYSGMIVFYGAEFARALTLDRHWLDQAE